MDGKTSHVHWPACAVVVVCLTAGSLAQGKYAGGSGRAEDPYLIRTAEQMNAVGLNQGSIRSAVAHSRLRVFLPGRVIPYRTSLTRCKRMSRRTVSART
jgi:hypothetical protein